MRSGGPDIVVESMPRLGRMAPGGGKCRGPKTRGKRGQTEADPGPVRIL